MTAFPNCIYDGLITRYLRASCEKQHGPRADSLRSVILTLASQLVFLHVLAGAES